MDLGVFLLSLEVLIDAQTAVSDQLLLFEVEIVVRLGVVPRDEGVYKVEEAWNLLGVGFRSPFHALLA